MEHKVEQEKRQEVEQELRQEVKQEALKEVEQEAEIITFFSSWDGGQRCCGGGRGRRRSRNRNCAQRANTQGIMGDPAASVCVCARRLFEIGGPSVPPCSWVTTLTPYRPSTGC